MSNLIPISLWSEADKPREKLHKIGAKLMSDSELLAILINNGNQNLSALDISRKLLSQNDDSLYSLAKNDLKSLLKVPGIGKAKATQILAFSELAFRINQTIKSPSKTICSSKSAFNLIKVHLSNLKYETFWVILLNRANHFINNIQISEGGVSGTIVDPLKIFKSAIDNSASAIILVHNHPSGNLKPSEMDKKITKQLVEGGKLLNIKVLDHLIVSDHSYFSFQDHFLME